jgi:D-glycero-alpha-D-manno-heptose-7-phosphate kinase
MAAALAHLRRESPSPDALAIESRHVEVAELGIAGGWQDHYAAAYGGALGLSFDRETVVERIPLSAATIEALESRLTVLYTGESRISAETITAVLDAYATRDARVVAALDRMGLLARAMRAALHAADLSTLAQLVDEHWVHQKSLHPRITTARIDALEGAVRAAGATGFKALGASGGGCVLAISSAGDAEAVRRAAAGLGTVLPWRVARDGVRVES